MNRFLSWAAVFFLSGLALADLNDPAEIQKLLQGTIIQKDTINTKKEFQTITKAFFKQVSADAYAALAVNYAVYPTMFEEVTEGKTIKSNHDQTEHDYWLHLVIYAGPFTEHIYPEGHHTIVRPIDGTSEGKVLNQLTNYPEYIDVATQQTRLVPYQGGILVEDDVHILMKDETVYSKLVKNKLKEFFGKYTAKMRIALHGEP